jgi:hypothetical protein
MRRERECEAVFVVTSFMERIVDFTLDVEKALPSHSDI